MSGKQKNYNSGDNPKKTIVSPQPALASQEVIQRFKEDPLNPFLISFPRTGSHWLRMIVELYFERPLLVRTFFYPNRDDYLFLHDHDMELATQRQNVIYLYRDPVDTIFSLIMYHKEDINDRSRIAHWSKFYGQHLDKWLFREQFTTKKTVLSYECLHNSPVSEIKKLLDHFNMTLDKERLQSVIDRMSKKNVKKHTAHDPRVISRVANYDEQRKLFRMKYEDLVSHLTLDKEKKTIDGNPDSEKNVTTSLLSRKEVQHKITVPTSAKRKSNFIEVGFHGDQYLLKLVDHIVGRCNYFIETGTNVGSTLSYVARTYPDINCLSCEPDLHAFNDALNNTNELSNVSIYNETSQAFIERLKQNESAFFEVDVLFWLDAHGYGFQWPLKEEIYFITRAFKRAFILIDDYKVPGLDCFGYDEYQGQICSFDYVKEAINPAIEYHLYYPKYTDRTSNHHPLRGWGLIEFGYNNELKLSEFLQDKIQSTSNWTLDKDKGPTANLIKSDLTMQPEKQNILQLKQIKDKDHSLRPEFLNEMAQMFGAGVFIETGTFMGNTADTARNIFREVHTIEMGQDLYHAAEQRFARYDNCHVYQGDSPDVLRKILPEINGKVFIWLDAHYSKGITARGETNTPIISELQAIKESGKNDAIILIDDIRNFQPVDPDTDDNSALYGYPLLQQVRNMIIGINKEYKFVILGDIALAYPSDSKIVISSLIHECTVSRLFDGDDKAISTVFSAEESIAGAQGQEREAFQTLAESVLATGGSPLGGHYRLWYGLILVKENRYAEACIEFQQAIDRGCDHWRVLWYLAHASYKAEDNEQAEKAALAVTRLAPEFAEARLFLNRLDKNRVKENSGHVSIQSEPAINYQDIQQMIESGKTEKAIHNLESMLRSAPEFAQAHNDLGALYYKKWNKEMALTHYGQALHLNPEEIYIVKELADYCFLKSGRFEEAMDIYIKILSFQPEDIGCLLIMGDIFVRQGKRDHARVLYSKVLEIDPQNPAASKFTELHEAEKSAGTKVDIDSENEEARITKEQSATVQHWFRDKGDSTLRLNYPLNENSVVFDLGGYMGDWSQKIAAIYSPYIYIFEPVPKYYSLIVDKFKHNPKISVFSFGLFGATKTEMLALEKDGSSIYGSSGDVIEISLVDVYEFLAERDIKEIDLMKINIEGAEYPLLKRMIQKGIVEKCCDIQIQFHTFYPDAVKLRNEIRNTLQNTHILTYDYPFVWENWRKKESMSDSTSIVTGNLPVEQNALTRDTTSEKCIIYCIGDSHVSFFAGRDTIQPLWPARSEDSIPFFRSFRLGPVLAYNLCKTGTTTKGREALLDVLKAIPGGSTVLLCFGEIDCRAHMLKQSIQQRRSLENIVSECVDRYFGVVQEIRSMGYQPVVWNAIPSTTRDDMHSLVNFPVYGTCLERNHITRLFNQYLSTLTESEGIKFISIFDELVNEHGLTRTEYYQQERIHLSQKAMPLTIQKLVTAGIISGEIEDNRE